MEIWLLVLVMVIVKFVGLRLRLGFRNWVRLMVSKKLLILVVLFVFSLVWLFWDEEVVNVCV